MNRLKGLEVQEVSLVDDPAVDKARYLVVKRNTAVPAEGMTDTQQNKSLAERLGSAVIGLLGGQPGDEMTRTMLAKHLADAEAESTESEAAPEGEAEAEKAREKCAECGEFLDGEEHTHKSADAEADEAEAETAKSTESEAAPEGEAEVETEKAAEAEEAAEAAAPEFDAQASYEALSDQIKSLSASLTQVVEAMSKNLDATTGLTDRITAMEERKGVSKSLSGSDVQSVQKGQFESLIFGA